MIYQGFSVNDYDFVIFNFAINNFLTSIEKYLI